MPASNRRPLWEDGDGPPSVGYAQPPPENTDATVEPSPFSTPAAASVAAPQAGVKQPCTLKGAGSAVYAGMLGYFLGVVPAAIKFKARQWGMIHSQGLASAQQLALMSGMYTAIHCICQRIRLVEDGWNRGIAGCSTGLVLGWSNGPWGALQSCAGLGLISALIDLGGGVEAAEASTLQPLQHMPVHKQHGALHPGPIQQQQQQPPAPHSSLQGLCSLPAPAQLMALLWGVAPQELQPAVPFDTAAEQQQGLKPSIHRRSNSSSQHSQPGLGRLPSPAQVALQQQSSISWQSQAEQPQQQSFAAAAALLAPAAHAVQQLVLAPPLMFLGACCQDRSPALGPLVAEASVDGCSVAPLIKATGLQRRS